MIKRRKILKDIPKDNPVEKFRKELPKGDGNFARFDHVYDMLNKAACNMAKSKTLHLSDTHVETMAILGCGHEETMKYHMAICKMYGWC